MVKVEVQPLVEAAGIKFGMKRDEVRNILGTAKEFIKSKYSKTTSDDFGFCHVFYDTEDGAEAVEFFEEAEVSINGQVVFPGSAELILGMFSDFVQDSSGYISIVQSIGIYAPDGRVESILFGCKGYYG